MATQQGGRRRLDSSVPQDYDVPTRAPRLSSPQLAYGAMSVTIVAWVLGVAGAGTAVVAVGAPEWVQRPAAALLMVVFMVALVHRAGGHMRLWVPPTVLLAVLTVVVENTVLLASSAVVTAMCAAVWSVLVTRPAGTVVRAMGEFAVTIVVALSGTVAVAAWNAPVNYQRFNLIVLGAALGLAIALVWGLGAGLHGMGRQNFAILVGVAVVVVLILAYSSFVRAHGSQVVVDLFTDSVIWTRENFGGVPRPVEVLLGFPAVVVGVSVRSQRREGWWILVFSVIGTAVLTTSLVTPGAFPSYIGLSTLYSVVLGGAIGLAVRSQVVTTRSSRAARQVEPLSRVEPGRFAPLK
jgi:hypothetical protein